MIQTTRASQGATLSRSAQQTQRLAYFFADWRFLVLLGLLVLLFVSASQAGFSKTINLGSDDGYDRANAFTFDFYAPEQQGEHEFRWSKEHGRLVFPGVGAQHIGLEFELLAHRAQFIDPERPTVLNLEINQQMMSFTLRQERAHYRILVPESWMSSGDLDLIIQSEPWRIKGDSRSQLGVAIGDVSLRGWGSFGARMPYWPVLLSWLLVLVCAWPTGRWLGFSPKSLFVLLLPLVVVPMWATLIVPAYLGLGNRALLLGCAWGLLLTVLLQYFVPKLLRALDIEPNPVYVRWLILIMVASFVLKYGGRLYPSSMYGDLSLHWHRFIRTISGSVNIMAAHRGLPFPFPSGMYIALAPLSLTGIPTWVIFEFLMALLEATTPLLIALLGARALGSLRIGVIGGGLYAIMAGGYMTTWFAFETHLFTQWATLLLWTLLIFCWPHDGKASPLDKPFIWSLLILVQCWVYLGHTGFFLNNVTLIAMAVPMLLVCCWNTPHRRTALQVCGVFVLGGLTAAAIYYSAFFGLIWEQVTGVATVGLLEVTGRQPVSRAESWRHLWEDGILMHYGFFPFLLAIVAVASWLLNRRFGKFMDIDLRTVLIGLIVLTFLTSLSQAVLPFITRSTLTTRFLMFSIWAVSLAAAPIFDRIWRYGIAGKVVVLLMGAFVSWGTIVMWANALALNVAPPEPF